VGINTRDLASLAALGALGYALSRGKKSDVPVEDRKGVPVEQITSDQTLPIGDDQYNPDVKQGPIPRSVSRSTVKAKAIPPIRGEYEDIDRLLARKPAPTTTSAPDTGDETARLLRRRPAPAPVRDTGDETARLLRRRPAPAPAPVRDTGDETARLARRVPRTYGPQDIPTGGYPSVAAGESASGSELGRNVKNTLAAMGPGKLAGVGNIATEMATAKRVQDAYNARAASRRAAEGFSPSESIARRRMMEEAAFEGGMKRGGKVKKMASGGSVKSSASRRADGIAQRGKTKGKFY